MCNRVKVVCFQPDCKFQRIAEITARRLIAKSFQMMRLVMQKKSLRLGIVFEMKTGDIQICLHIARVRSTDHCHYA